MVEQRQEDLSSGLERLANHEAAKANSLKSKSCLQSPATPRSPPVAQSAGLAKSLKDERGALAAGRRAGGASLTDLETQARI